MKKIFWFFIFFMPIQVWALVYPNLHYNQAIIYDMTDDKILYEKDSMQEVSIASLTKIVTTITAIENIEDLDEIVTYTSAMASLVRWDASVAGLKIGDKITYKDLLYASILPSGADATTALALATTGSIDGFVEKMNEMANKIGMKQTHFVNVTGLDAEGHYSTANDILKLLKYSLQNEVFKEIYTTKTYTLSNNLFVKSTIYAYRGNTDRILGSKTGFTMDAGRCISTYFQSNGHEMLLVTLGASSDSKTIHIMDALDLIDFLNKNYHDQQLVEENRLVKEIPVLFGKVDTIFIMTGQQVSKFLPDDYDKSKVKIVYDGLEELSFHNQENEKLGTIFYYYDEELLSQEDIYLQDKIEMDIIKLLVFYKNAVFLVLVIFILFILVMVRRKKRLNNKLVR